MCVLCVIVYKIYYTQTQYIIILRKDTVAALNAAPQLAYELRGIRHARNSGGGTYTCGFCTFHTGGFVAQITKGAKHT